MKEEIITPEEKIKILDEHPLFHILLADGWVWKRFQGVPSLMNETKTTTISIEEIKFNKKFCDTSSPPIFDLGLFILFFESYKDYIEKEGYDSRIPLNQGNHKPFNILLGYLVYNKFSPEYYLYFGLMYQSIDKSY